MRVRRRSSADHLIFQRDPVAHLNRPPAPSPLSLPPTSEEEVTAHTPTSAHSAESPSGSISSIPHVETLASAREWHPPTNSTIAEPSLVDIQAPTTSEHSRTASLGETQTSRTSSHHVRSAASTSRANSLRGKGNRANASLGFGSIFGRGSRPGSPVHDEGHPENLQSNGSEQVREKSCAKRISLFSHNGLGRKGEALPLEEEHKEVGDGWQEFRKGLSVSFGRPPCRPLTPEGQGHILSRFLSRFRHTCQHH